MRQFVGKRNRGVRREGEVDKTCPDRWAAYWRPEMQALSSDDSAGAIVLSMSDNREIIKRAPQILDSDCHMKASKGAYVDSHFPDETLQYAIADALVQADYQLFGPSSFDDTPPLAHNPMTTPEEGRRR